MAGQNGNGMSPAAELEALQLEETKERVHQMRQRREGIKRRVEGRDRDLRLANARQKAIQDNCWHKKGGKGVAMLSRGNDHNYAVQKHQLCHGPIIVICQRCSKVWEPPPPEWNRRGATPEQKAEYKRLYDEYMVALNFPTDNEMSGTQLFVIEQNEAA
jgi:hypothetical protein